MTRLTSSRAKELENIIAKFPVYKDQELLDLAHYLRQEYKSYPNGALRVPFLKR